MEAKTTLRDSCLIGATQHFVESLKALEIETVVIGYALTEDPQGQGVTKVIGNSTLVLNLVAAIIKAMRPEDFRNLLAVMLKGEYFADHRGEKIEPVDPKRVN